MSKLRKALRIELHKINDTKAQVQKAIDTFNRTINESMQTLNKESLELEKLLIKLEK